MNISPAESAVMEVLWSSSPLSAEDIIKAVQKHQPWQEPTVKSLINRLLKKRAITAKKDGRRYLYSPKVERTRYLTAQSAGILDRLFGGRIAPLVAHFSEEGKLTKKDVAELKALLKEIERGR